MVKKQTGPGTPWSRPGPFKNLGKTKGCYRGAAGNLRACWGPPRKSYGRWKPFKNLGKTKGWGRGDNVAKKTGKLKVKKLKVESEKRKVESQKSKVKSEK